MFSSDSDNIWLSLMLTLPSVYIPNDVFSFDSDIIWLPLILTLQCSSINIPSVVPFSDFIVISLLSILEFEYKEMKIPYTK